MRQYLAVRHYLTLAKNVITRYVTRKEEGATLAEYGLLLALIAVVCILAITALGTSIRDMFFQISDAINAV